MLLQIIFQRRRSGLLCTANNKCWKIWHTICIFFIFTCMPIIIMFIINMIIFVTVIIIFIPWNIPSVFISFAIWFVDQIAKSIPRGRPGRWRCWNCQNLSGLISNWQYHLLVHVRRTIWMRLDGNPQKELPKYKICQCRKPNIFQHDQATAATPQTRKDPCHMQSCLLMSVSLSSRTDFQVNESVATRFFLSWDTVRGDVAVGCAFGDDEAREKIPFAIYLDQLCVEGRRKKQRNQGNSIRLLNLLNNKIISTTE